MNIANEIEVLVQPQKTFDEMLAVGMPSVIRPRLAPAKNSWIKPGNSTEERLNRVGEKHGASEEEKLWALTLTACLRNYGEDFSPYQRNMAVATSIREGMTAREIYMELAEKNYFPASFTEGMCYLREVAGKKVPLGKVFHLGTLLHDEKYLVWIVETIGFDKIKAKLLTPAKPFALGSQFVVIKDEKKKK